MSDVQGDEREHLLRSLDDLDLELAAGDLDPHDYETLRADYTTRVATSLRNERGAALTQQRLEPESAGQTTTSPGSDRSGDDSEHEEPQRDDNGLSENATSRADRNTVAISPSTQPNRRAVRRVGAIVGVLGVAVGSGVAVARFAGERVGSTGLTGTVRQAASPEQLKVQALMQVGRDNLGSDPFKSLQAFDAALKIDPQLPEAMAYSGWVLRIASLSAEGKDAEGLRAGAVRRINQAIISDPSYPDAYAFKGVIALRDQDDPKTALAAFKKLDGLETPPFVQQLVGTARQEAEEALKDSSNPSATTDSLKPAQAE